MDANENLVRDISDHIAFTRYNSSSLGNRTKLV